MVLANLVRSHSVVWSLVFAGMPSPVLVITELGKRRLDELSFFLVGFLVSAYAFRGIWNSLSRDIAGWPKMSYRTAVFSLLLWGSFMMVVLSLVSGARELMTPAAWEPNGITHKLKGSTSDNSGDKQQLDARRIQRMETLRFALWQFAANHEGRFPTSEEIDDPQNSFDPKAWIAVSGPNLRYVYTSGLTTKSPVMPLVYEPQTEAEQLVLMTNGDIVRQTFVQAAPVAGTTSGAAPAGERR